MSEWEPREVVIPQQRPWGRLLLLATVLLVAGWGLWLFRGRMKSEAVPSAAMPGQVQSDVTGIGDSLDIIVTWSFVESAGGRRPDSVRVEVGFEGTDARVSMLPGKWRADTLRIAAPAPGGTALGHSCVSGVHAGRLSRESCTPWQFVRPTTGGAPTKPERTDTVRKKEGRAGATPSKNVIRVVVRPSGLQVDPDIEQKCAKWQRANPGRAVWIEVNVNAVPECTGPNRKPTVAQFCAFAVLEDGERVKTSNSNNNPYCEGLYRAWVRERLS